eukprot:gnl/Carplike_NY0171/12693_a18381_95.p1 GENE.gnl/Carplike_NY0171/12693_a18381_95~~gnl/Carplike_NY0171/12693_a18381_95.p1  ORF type:complete len:210 (-),score=41.01 gnl/Carplike_NY0171/12693_a18381_95:154-738(-)
MDEIEHRSVAEGMTKSSSGGSSFGSAVEKENGKSFDSQTALQQHKTVLTLLSSSKILSGITTKQASRIGSPTRSLIHSPGSQTPVSWGPMHSLSSTCAHMLSSTVTQATLMFPFSSAPIDTCILGISGGCVRLFILCQEAVHEVCIPCSVLIWVVWERQQWVKTKLTEWEKKKQEDDNLRGENTSTMGGNMFIN